LFNAKPAENLARFYFAIRELATTNLRPVFYAALCGRFFP